jgi:Cellulase (glycosyl hydrolase family 5)
MDRRPLPPLSTVLALLAAPLAALLASLALLGALASPAQAGTVLRGMADNRFTDQSLPLAQRLALVRELGTTLRGQAIRLDCQWPLAEPRRGAYDDSGYLADLKAVADAAHADGLKVIVLILYVPRWASDKSYWSHPPAASYSGYQWFYPVAAGSLDDLGAFSGHVAALLRGEVLGYECWNEPNLWPYIYPQRTAADNEFAAHTYLGYLRAMSPAIRAADPGALVIAGATAPSGENNVFRTAPQTFARQLKTLGAAPWFDVYSHHPYCVGGRADLDPALPPAHPDRTIELANIGTLLRIFPAKPFYLTEYGYSTRYSWAFGPPVNETQQAIYLRKALAMVARHPQIKLLLWFLDRDISPSGASSDANGVYTGLRRLGGGAKPAWYAFAGGDHLTLSAPTTVRQGAVTRLSGRLSCASVGGVKGKQLRLLRRRGNGAWITAGGVTTGTDGEFSLRVRVRATQRYRLLWPGVVSSPTRLVRAS